MWGFFRAVGEKRTAAMGLQKCDLVWALIPAGFAHRCLGRGCSPLCFWHCNSCTAIVPFLRLCKSTLWNQASEQHRGTGNCCLSFSEAELRGRGKGTGLRWQKKLGESALVSVSQSKTLKHWLNNVLFQHGMVWNVEQPHLGQMFTSVCWSLGNACSAADLDKMPRYRQCEGAYSQICNGCKNLHLKVIWNSF